MKFLFDFVGRMTVAKLLAGLLLLSISDLVGIAIIFPYLKIIAEPSIVESNRYLQLVYQAIGFQSQRQFIYMVSASLLMIFTAKTGMSLLLSRYQYRNLAKIAHRLTSVLFGMLMRARYDFFLTHAPSELMGMNYAYSAQVVVCFQAWLGMVNESIFFVLIFGAALYVQPIATLMVATFCVLVIGALYLLIIKRIVRYGREQGEIDAARHRWTFATVSSIKDLKIMGLGGMFFARTDELSEQSREIAWRNSFVGALPKVSIEYLIICAFIVAAVLFIQSGKDMENLLPLLGLMALAALRILPAFGRLTGHYSAFKYSKNYLDKLQDFYATLNASRHEITSVESTFLDRLEIRHLNFSYGDKNILKDLSMTVKKGASIGIVGASGSGKSTLLDIITGLQEKQAGQFILDGKQIDPYTTDAIRQHVGYVPQQIALIDESIAFNIAFTHDYDRAKIASVLKTANLDVFVGSLADGMETSVGESGARLSGGQKQRLGIARALYRDPDILIFDESTSALDNMTEKELSAEIQALAGNKTLIIVAHRLTTIMGCDLIHVIEHGRILASGTHAQLLENCALYRTMHAPEIEMQD